MLPWVILVFSGVCFSLVSLLESSVLSVRRERVQMLVAQEARGSDSLAKLYTTPFGPTGALAVLKFLVAGVSLASTAALLANLESRHWTEQYGVGLVVLGGLGLIQVFVIGLSRVFGESTALSMSSTAYRLSRLLSPVMVLGIFVVESVVSISSGADGEGESVPGEHNGSGETNG